MENEALRLLQLFRGDKSDGQLYLSIVDVVSEAPLKLQLSGAKFPLGESLFEIPESFKPLLKGDRFFALPVVSDLGQRWGLITRLNR